MVSENDKAEPRLYCVTVEHTVYVLAENCCEAEAEAERAVRQGGEEADFRTNEVEPGSDRAKWVSKAWLESTPVNGDGRKVAEILGVE